MTYGNMDQARHHKIPEFIFIKNLKTLRVLCN